MSTRESVAQVVRMVRCLGVLLSLGMWCASAQADNLPTWTLHTPAGVSEVSTSMDYLIDDSATWAPHRPLPAPLQWRAVRERPSHTNFAHNKSPIWLRLTLLRASGAPADWQWVVTNPQIEWLELWVQPQGGPMQRFKAGLGAIEQGQARAQRHPALPLTLAENTPTTVWMRVQSEGLLQIPVEIWPPTELREREQRTLTALGAYFGLLAGLLIYNGFLAAKLRDKAYAQYIALGIAQGVFQLSNTGIGHLYVWTAHAMDSFLIRSLSIACFAALALTFTNSFLRLEQKLPAVSRVLRASSACWALLLVAHIGVDTQTLVRTVTVPLALWTVLLILYAGVAGWLKGSPAAGYFVLAWSGVVLAGIVRVLLNLGLLPPHPVTYDGILLASAAEMLLLAMALADRIATERRARSEAEALRLREQADKEIAQRALQEKSSFMAAVAHDLQQPIYAISLAIGSIHRQPSNGSSLEATQHMRSALQVADELLASLAMAVHLERSDLKPDIQTFSVQDMLERIDSMFAPIAQQRGLSWHVTPSLALAHSDSALLERMLCNLVSNAFRYTKTGGVLLGCRERSGHLLIQVWDTGPGIAPDEQELVFLMHQRGRHHMGQQQGLGLGLAIVKGCADLLGIRVELRSTLQKGTCFGLRVPCPPPAQPAAQDVSAQATRNPPPPSSPSAEAPARGRPASPAPSDP